MSVPAARTLVGSVIGTVLALALIGIAFLANSVSQELRQLRGANSDNVQWTLSQAEVEFLEFGEARNLALSEPSPDLDAVRRRFDILYSRMATLTSGRLFEGLARLEHFTAPLAEVTATLDAAIPLIDGDDAGLIAALPEMDARMDALRDEVRDIATSGLRWFAQESDRRRTEISRTLLRLAQITVLLILALMLLAAYFGRVSWQNARARDELRQAGDRMQTVISTSLDAVIVTDTVGRILEFNEAAERIFGHERHRARGQTIGELIVPEHHRAAHEAGMARLARGGARHVVGKGRVRLEGMRRSGEIFPVEFSIQSAERDGEEIFIAFLRDISASVSAERELIAARDQALAGERAKASFLAVMSHEIRTPLNGLLGNLALLRDTPLSERQEEMTDRMDLSGRILMNHVNDVLDIARFEAGKLRVTAQPFHLSARLQEMVDAQSGGAEANETVLDWSWTGAPQDWIATDGARLEQVLLNLVGNAIKFTVQGRISIEAEILSRKAQNCVLELRVIDTGIGIPENEIGRIFDDFVTHDSSYGRQVGGTGLGLGIARRIITALDGEIGAESEEGAGSLFWLRLPVTAISAPEVWPEAHAPRPAATERAATGPAAPTPREILVVEDNEINRQVIREMLARDGHRVTEAVNGRQGVSLAAGARFDLILMDIAMPVMDGRQATREIRGGDGASHDVPIVALTANVMAEEVASFHADGMDAILAKPISVSELRDIVARFGGTVAGAHAAKPAAPDRDGGMSLDADHAHATREAIGGPAYDALLARFSAEATAFIAYLRDETAPAETVAADAHNLAGSAGLFGAHNLRRALLALERHAEDPETTDLAPQSAAVVAAWAEAEQVLNAMR